MLRDLNMVVSHTVNYSWSQLRVPGLGNRHPTTAFSSHVSQDVPLEGLHGSSTEYSSYTCSSVKHSLHINK